MIDVKFRNPISIIAVAALVVATDVVVIPILSFNHQTSPAILVNDFTVVLLAGLTGLYISQRIGCRLWWRPHDGSPASRRATMIAVLLSLTIVAGNTLVYLAYGNQAIQAAPWLTLLTPERAIAISIRAALTEEIFYRLFLFPLIAWISWRLTKSKEASLVIGALTSTVAFGLTHPGFVLAFLIGLATVYIYYHRGLLPAMTTHFFADAIPFLLISLAYI